MQLDALTTLSVDSRVCRSAPCADAGRHLSAPGPTHIVRPGLGRTATRPTLESLLEELMPCLSNCTAWAGSVSMPTTWLAGAPHPVTGSERTSECGVPREWAMS